MTFTWEAILGTLIVLQIAEVGLFADGAAVS